MPKMIDYSCKECSYEKKDVMYNDTEEVLEVLEDKCPECGGPLSRGLNLKNNSQCWRVSGL